MTASLAIYDTMQFVKNDIATFAIGQAAGTALLLLAAGTKGKRFALPHSRLHFADIWGGTEGSASNVEIQKEEIARLKKAIFAAYAKITGRSVESIEGEHGTGKVYNAAEAMALGLVDRVIEEVPRSELPGAGEGVGREVP